MDDLVQWLREQLDEDELWAREASRRNEDQAASEGVRWQWVDPETDRAVTPDPGRDEFVGGEEGFRVALRSRETWPTQSGVGHLPQFAIPTAEEVPSAVGGHIIRHDPARVLREIDAKRQILRQAFEHAATIDGEWGCCHDAEAIEAGYCEEQRPNDLRLLRLLRLLALPYAGRPGYREEWRP